MRTDSNQKPARGTSKNNKFDTRPSKDQHVDPSPRPNLQEPTSVQDRIRQWQAQGAANALAPDAISVRSIPISECLSTSSRAKSDYGDDFNVRVGRRAKEKDKKNEDNERSKSTPRRRIISDSHWKAHNDAKDKSTKPKVSPRPESRRYDPSYTSNQETTPKARRRSRTSRSIIPDQEVKPPAQYDDGIRVAPLHTEDVSDQVPPPIYDLESRIDDELARHLTTESIISGDFERRSETSEKIDNTSPSDWRPSRYAETLGKPTPTAPSLDTPRSKKGRLLGKTKGMFLKSENVPQVSNRLPSIEAWLDEQPDPFVESQPLEDLPPVEVPQPLRKRTHRKRSSGGKSVLTDPNLIWDSISPGTDPVPPVTPPNSGSMPFSTGDRNSTSRRRATRNADHDESEGSPSGLRRRGAKVHRQRDLSRRSTAENDEQAQPLSSPAEDPTVEEDVAKSPTARPCPPTGAHRLSTIASVETLGQKNVDLTLQESEPHRTNDLKRKLTTHDDLMSVLSMPRGSKNRRSARNTRASRAKQYLTSARDALDGLTADEQKYSRELQTLVDGVIPVLLQFVLSKTDAAAAAGLFTSSTGGPDGVSITKPIIDMGVALERLKNLHRRVPLDNVENLLHWAQTSEKAYRDYLQAWRLGFQDVVVNLAPLENPSAPDQGMARDDAGDVIDTEGKKVDVAYLLKRPLVRVKAFSRTFGQIKAQCDIPLAAQMADAYADLTTFAKRRNQEEQARLEDEAASNIDATRARDIRSMSAMTQVDVNKSRRVKARDFFNLTIYHSSGQRLDCGVELIFRDSARGDLAGGDVLVCEVDDRGKWLLFAPLELNCVSARRGEDGFDMVVMVRGRAGFGKEWHELLALKTEDKEAVTEWMNMLGSNPLPPRLNRTQVFDQRPAPLAIMAKGENQTPKSEATSQPSVKDPAAVRQDLPIGEPSVLGPRSELSQGSDTSKPLVQRPSPGLNLGGGLASKPIPQYHSPTTKLSRRPVPSVVSSDRSTISDRSTKDTLTTLTSSSLMTSSTNSGYHAKQPKPFESLKPSHPSVPSQIVNEVKVTKQLVDDRTLPRTPRAESMPHPTKNDVLSPQKQSTRPASSTPKQTSVSTQPIAQSTPSTSSPTRETSSQRPVYNRAVSSTPSRELPTVNKVRSQQVAASEFAAHKDSLQRSPEKQPPSRESRSSHNSSRDEKRSSKSQIYTEDVPAPPAHSSRQGRPRLPSFDASSSPPATPPHRSGILQPTSNVKISPVLKPNPSPSDKTLKRRGSSPLKHEYAPSTSSSSSSNYDSDSESDTSSDTSEDFMSEHGDVPTPLVAITGGRRTSKPSVLPSMPPSSMKSTGTRTLAPSDSASQGPYRSVPASNTVPQHKKNRTIALICTWSDRGMWEQIYPDECSILISPGLIEAFEMSAAHSNPRANIDSQSSADSDSRTSSLAQQPLVAFELTPIVPLRRGTALDISIRSPPTANSKIRTTNNVMFRSRNPEECEALYGMINWARCNNPTYIQLQNARPHRQPSVTFNVGQTEQNRAKSSSWFSFGGHKESSYRASSAPAPVSVDMSVESSGTMNSAFSALKRLGVSNAFNLHRSSVHRKSGSSGRGGSLYSSSSGSGTRTGSGSSTPAPSQMGFVPGKDGPNVPSTSAAAAEGGGMVNNMKIRLYIRKGQHWENLGAARLTVLPAPVPESGQTTPNRPGFPAGASPPATPRHARSPSNLSPVGGGPRLPSSSHTPHRVHGNGREKRVVITGKKSSDVVLLDSVLGESCFERVMQTGIAVKVWSEDEMIADTGGVTLGKERVYMMQFPGTREAGWVFGLCGTYRYGAGSGGE